MSKRDPGEREPAKKGGAPPPGGSKKDAPGEVTHGPDWEPSGPEWAPPAKPPGDKPTGPEQPAKKDDEEGAPAKAGDPPIEQPFGERSRHEGSGERSPGGA